MIQKERLQRLSVRWQKITDKIPLRWSGLVLLASLQLLFYFLAYKRQDLVLLVSTTILTLIFVPMIFLVLETYWTLSRALATRSKDSPQRYRLEVGFPYRLKLGEGFYIPRRPFVEVEWKWLDPTGCEICVQQEHSVWFESIVFDRRCLVEKVERWVEVRDVLGIAAMRTRWTEPTSLEVVPPLTLLDRSTLITSLHLGEELPDPAGEPVGDRVDMRRYASGDPPRFILWKVLARSRKLMVRVPERAFAPTPRMCAYLLAGDQDQLAASLARAVLEGGALGAGWRFGADGSTAFTTTVDGALELVARSGNVGAEKQSGLSEFLTQAEKDGYQSCLLFVPSSQGAWLSACEKTLHAGKIPVTVVVCDDSRPGSQGMVGEASAMMQRLEYWVLKPSHRRAPFEPKIVAGRLRSVSRQGMSYDPVRGTVHYLWGSR